VTSASSSKSNRRRKLEPINEAAFTSFSLVCDLFDPSREKQARFVTAHFARTKALVRGIGKRFVYILRSQSDPSRHYVGITGDVDTRLEWHNNGPCGYTRAYRPWKVIVSIEFPTERQAVRFERYLKSGSGRAFATRHFAPLD
jgi:predicted GIY-YIG superfamily endonuclease